MHPARVTHFCAAVEANLIPYQAVTAIPARAALVLAPHPDDETFGCGGAIAAHVGRHEPVRVVVLTDGGGAGEPAQRQQETCLAAQRLGCAEPDFWALPDRGLVYAEALVQRLVEAIRRAGADLVYAPSPYEVHPDHRQACALAMAAVERLGYPLRLAFYEIGVPLRPNLLLDITAQLPAKQAAMQCFASQLARQDYVRHISALNVYRTYTLPAGVEAAEAYWLLDAADLGRGAVAQGLAAVSPGLAEPAPAALPRVSVLIRSMDRPDLARALDSVALQTYPNIEIVVVAARPDHSPLPERWGPFPLRLCRTAQPLPRSKAANAALDAARGDLLLLLDDDDWLMPDHIARLAGVLAAQPQTLAAYTGIALVDADNRPLGQAFDLPFDAVRLQAGNLTPIHAVLFRAQALQRGLRFDETLDRYEDWDFWLQLAKQSNFAHLPGISAVYRVHQSSGVHDDAGTDSASTRVIHQKWQAALSDADGQSLMQRVWACNTLDESLQQARAELALAQSQLAASRQHADNLQHSFSWRITRPLRSLSHRARAGAAGPWLQRLARLRAIQAEEGWPGVAYRLKRRLAKSLGRDLDYGDWAVRCDSRSAERMDQLRPAIAAWPLRPLISIVMPVYNPPLELLHEAIQSVRDQIYPHWELCIADDATPGDTVWAFLQAEAAADPRIRIVRREANGHISQASNSALALASGEYVALMDNDDLLPPDALYWVADAVNRRPSVQLIYSDEDKLDGQGRRFGAYFKPDWNYTLFLGHNLISHLGVYRTALMREVGGFRLGLEGSQDYDLALRCLERIEPADVVHIPRVLYHWRAIEGSTAMATEAKPYAVYAAQRALREHRERIGRPCPVEILPTWNYRCHRPEPADATLSVVLVEHDGAAAPDAGWTAQPAYGVGEVLRCGADAAAIDAAVARATGRFVALIRADLAPSAPDALRELLGYAAESGTGVAGGTVRAASGALRAGGLLLHPAQVATVLFHGLPAGHAGYMGRSQLAQELSAVSLDCVVFRKEILAQGGGLDADLGCSDPGAVAWCLRLRDQGLKVIWVPQAEWREPAGRPGARNDEAARRRFIERYGPARGERLACDPAYHPQLDALAADFSLAARGG